MSGLPVGFKRNMDEQAGLAATEQLAGDKQLRRLEDFSIHNADDPHQPVGLESLHQQPSRVKPVASGTLLAADGAPSPGAKPVSVVTGPIIDWCLEYGNKPAVWMLTKSAWYRLGKPHAEYSSTYESVHLRLELAVRCAGALATDPTAAAGVVRHRVLNGLVAGSNGTPVLPQQLSEAAEFLAAQMAALHQAGSLLSQPLPGASAADVLPFVGWLKQEGAAVSAAAPPAIKKQRVGEAGQAVVTAAADGLPQQQPLVTAPLPVQAATTTAGPSPASAPASTAEQPMPATAAAAALGQARPAHKLKINMPGSNLKPKFKLKGQILPQSQPPPQDIGSQIQGHPPGLHEGQAQQHAAHKPKLKFVMPKAGPKQQEVQQQQQQLQHQESWQFSDAQGGWGPPPPYPTSAPHGAIQQQRPYDYSAYEYYDDQGYSQQQQHQTARQQQRAAAATAKQAAVQAKAAAAAARAEEQARRHQQRLLELEIKRQAEITADIARGAPPAPTRSFRLPSHYVGELLAVWELCQTFGGVLNIPPFSLEQLEAALLPGPLTEQQQQQSAAVTGAAADAEALKAAQAAAAQLASQLAEAAAAVEKAAAGGKPVAADQQPPSAAAAEQATTQQPAAAKQQPSGAEPGSSGKEQLVSAVGHQAAADRAAAGDAGAAPPVTGAAAAKASQQAEDSVPAPPQQIADKKTAACSQQPASAVAVTSETPIGSAAGAPPAAADRPEPPERPRIPAAESAAGQQQGKPSAYITAADTADDMVPPSVPHGSAADQQTAEAVVLAPAVAEEQGAGAEPSVVAAATSAQAVEPAVMQKQQAAQQLKQPADKPELEHQQNQQLAVEPGNAQQQSGQQPWQQEQLGNAEQAQKAEQLPQLATQQDAKADAGQTRVVAVPGTNAVAGATGRTQQQPAVQDQADQQQQIQQQQQVTQVLAESAEQQPALKQEPPVQSLPGQQQEQAPPQQQPEQQRQPQPQPQQRPQTPFANQQPAPSTTSVGTGQAAASNNTGVAPSPAKQKLKFKVRLSGTLKQNSSQLQQATSSMTASAATGTTGLDPAAGAAKAAVDPAAAGATNGVVQGAAAAPPVEEDEVQQQQQVDVGIADHVNMASSLILRDVHSALLRLVDGTAPKPGKKPPKQPLLAKLCPGDTNQRHLAALMVQPHWSHRVAYAVSAAAGTLLTSSDFHAQDVCSALLNSDYSVLPLDLRMSALRCLVELALASDTFKAHLDVRIETYSAPKALRAEVFRAFTGVLGSAGTGQRGRPKGSGYGGGQQHSGGPSVDEKRVAAAAAEKSIGGRMIDEWMEWISQQEQRSSGSRLPLGVDLRGQQYWVLGGAAGAWRVFVEQQEGALWGYYEGEQLLQLMNWLACAAIEAEAPLLHTLCTMPWPYKPNLVLTALSGTASASAAAAGADPPESPGSIAYWANVAAGSGTGGYQSANSYAFGYCFTPLEAGVEACGSLVMSVGMRVPDAGQLMGVRQMQRLRPDGYRKLCAPLMLGEAGVPGGSVLNSAEERIHAAIGSMVAVLSFWLKQQQQHILQQLGQLMESLLVADGPAAYCSAVLSLETLLSHPQVQPAPVRPSWATDWQQAWRDSLAATGPHSSEAVSLHLAMLGSFAVVDEYRLGRDTFMRIVTNNRCPLVFPAVGDVYMFSRSGSLKHVDKYSKLPASATAPLPPAAEELSATAAAIKQLPPMSCYKVVALAYCSYPMPEALKQQQRQQVAAAAAAHPVADDDDDVDGATVPGIAAAGVVPQAPSAAAAAVAVSEPGLSDDWPGLATLGDDGAEDVESLLAFDIDELEIDTLPGQMTQQHQHQHHHHGHHHHHHHQHHQHGPGQHPQPGGGEAAAAPTAAPGDAAAAEEPKHSSLPLQTAAPGAPEYRPPCMWALMSPVDLSSSKAEPQHPHYDAATSIRDPKRPYIVVPFHVDANLPDFLVPVPLYESAMEYSWLPGDKFSMYFGGKPGQKTGGNYYKGSIVNVDEGQDRDPWCSIEVLWEETDGDSSQHTAKYKLSPWDIEPDRDEVRKREEAARKAQQAAAAAEEVRRQEEAAAEARARRRASRTIADYSDLIGAVDDDDEYNPMAEGFSSDSDGGRRRRKKGKRGRGSDDEDFRDSAAPGAGEGGSKKRQKFKPAWNLDQIKQQQNRHLNAKQQQMLGAISTGNTLLLARLTSAPPNAPIHEQPFPLPLRPEVLAALPHEGFPALIADYNISARGKFTPLMWGQKELDMYALFMIVNARGGYEAVCRNNKWVDVCRAMGGPSDPDSRSNMRANYEKVLVEFEQYVRCGRWEQDMAAGKPPTVQKSDTDAAFEQVMRAGAAAAAAPPPPPLPPPPVAAAPGLGIAGLGLRPQLIAGAAGAIMPGVGLQPGATAFMARNAAGQPVLIQATPQQLLALQLAQQQQLLLAKQQARPGAPAGQIVLPAGLPNASGSVTTQASAGTAALPAANAAAQQQLLLRQQLLQQAQLQSAAASAAVKVAPVPAAAVAAGNPQLRALLQQQAAATRPAANATSVQLPGGLTLQQLQALQAQQLKAVGAAAGAGVRPASGAAAAGALRSAASLAPAASLALPPRPPAAPTAPAGEVASAAMPATSSALAGTGSMNFSALLDDLM